MHARRIGSFLPIFGLSVILLALIGCTQLSLLFDQPPKASFTVSPSTTDAMGTQIALDGSSSSDPQSYPLSYGWSLSKPTGSTAALSATSQAKVTFTPDAAGDYVVSLKVTEQSAGHKSATKSETITVTAGSSVQPPSNLVAASSTTAVAVDLSWTASATSGATYTIYRGTSSAGESPTPLVTGLQTTSYEDTAVQAGTTYYYIVVATAGTGTGAPSSEVYATPTTPTVTVQPPTGLAAAPSATAVAIDLTWTASTTSGATYTVYRGSSAVVSAQTAIATGITGTTYEDTGVQAGTAYYYTVTAVVNGVESVPSSGAFATPSTPTVQPPTGLTATASTASASITLDWTASTTSGATYNIYRGTASGGELPTPIATGVSGTPYTDDTVGPNTPYFYQVSAVAGGTESTPSTEASATTSAIVAPPAGLLATVNATATAIALTWTASPTPGVTYNVYRTVTPGTSTSPIATSVSATTYSDSSATPGTTYYYSVTATANGIESAATNMAQADLMTQPPTNLAAVSSASSVSVDLSWTPSVTSGVTYTVYRSTSASLAVNLSSTTPIATSLTAISYTDSDTALTPGTTYYYVVTAVGTNGDESGPSNLVQTITSSTGSGSGAVSVTVN